MEIRPIRQWATVEFVALIAEDGEPFAERAKLAFVFREMDKPDIWDAEAIIHNWVMRQNERAHKDRAPNR